MADWIEKRKEICKTCPLNKRIGPVRVCWPLAVLDSDGQVKRGCGCILKLKMRRARESCPQKKWLSILPAPQKKTTRYALQKLMDWVLSLKKGKE